VVHVTHTNALFWDTGSTPTRVIEHGLVDPGHHYSGEVPRAAVVVNEPVRRGRVTGTDLLDGFARAAPLDVFGMGVDQLGTAQPSTAQPSTDQLSTGGGSASPGERPIRTHEDLPQHELHRQLARRRVYLHPYRWTSLGLSLLEAMFLGLPVVALATTEVPAVVPKGAGCVSNDLGELRRALRHLLADPELAHRQGSAARAAVLGRFGLGRFLSDWDQLLEEIT
jgi:glycosyltransferase involved in cell wall biosynthesis